MEVEAMVDLQAVELGENSEVEVQPHPYMQSSLPSAPPRYLS